MTRTDPTDERLTAYADGELPAGEASELERRLATDPELAARLRRFAATRDVLRQTAREALLALPPGLEAKVRAQLAAGHADGDRVVALPARPGRWRPGAPLWTGALAASLALVVGGLGGYLLGAGSGEEARQATAAGLHEFPAAVAAALNRVPAGAETVLAGGTRLAPVSSFTGADGAFCREYELAGPDVRGRVEVACDGGTGWALQLAVVTGGGEGYAPAASLEVLDLFLTQTGAGAPLSVDEEAAALAARPD